MQVDFYGQAAVLSLISVLSTCIYVMQADQLIEILNSKGETNWSLALDPVLMVLDFDVTETSTFLQMSCWMIHSHIKLLSVWSELMTVF